MITTTEQLNNIVDEFERGILNLRYVHPVTAEGKISVEIDDIEPQVLMDFCKEKNVDAVIPGVNDFVNMISASYKSSGVEFKMYSTPVTVTASWKKVS